MSGPGEEPVSSASSQALPEPKPRRSYQQKLWVPIVLLIGLVAGELMSLAVTTETPQYRFGGGPPFFFHNFPTDPLFQFHIVLTTINVALLVSLVVVYGKMYTETKANFALGLVVVLFALLVQAVLTYPIFDSLIGPPTIEPGLSSLAADVFTICAYTLFLYLSLE